jgi:hypothetical protein
MRDPKMYSKPLKYVGGITLALAVVAAIYFVLPTQPPGDLVKATLGVDGGTDHGSDSREFIIEGRPARRSSSAKFTTIDGVLGACSIPKPPALPEVALEQVRMSIERLLRVQAESATPEEQDPSLSEIRAAQKAKLRRTGQVGVAGEFGTRTYGMQILRAELRAVQRGDYLAFPAGTGMGHWQALVSEQHRSPFKFVYVDTFDFSGAKVDFVVFIPKAEI